MRQGAGTVWRTLERWVVDGCDAIGALLCVHCEAGVKQQHGSSMHMYTAGWVVCWHPATAAGSSHTSMRWV
jgi:hypothetical protein